MRLAVIGAGGMGSLHAANAVGLGAEVHSVVDVDERAASVLADAVGATPMSSIDEALAQPGIDAIVVATAEATHPSLVGACVDAGRPVFCEKPLALDMDDAWHLRCKVLDAGAFVFFGFNRRFDPSRSALKRAVDDGEVGNVEIVRIVSCDTSETLAAHFAGGLFFNPYSHDLDAAAWLLGETPERVCAMGAELIADKAADAGEIDTCVVTMQTARGALATLSYSRRSTYGHDQRIDVHGASGMLQVINDCGTLVVRHDTAGVRSSPAEPDFRARYADAYRAEMAQFLWDLDAGRAPEVGIEDAWRAMLLGDAARRSFEGCTVESTYAWTPAEPGSER